MKINKIALTVASFGTLVSSLIAGGVIPLQYVKYAAGAVAATHALQAFLKSIMGAQPEIQQDTKANAAAGGN